ncbi:MAG: hypothetical protein KC917_18450 [Candidatus Omnitrophica bacterium]|nr:hypothetical protein [Candidatus Omnitrophota bacterium]
MNFNHLSFIEISDRYLEDSLKTIRRDPVGYGETLVRAFLLFFRPPSEMSFLDGNREKIETWNAFFTRWVTLQILPFEKATKLDREGGFPISFLVCCYFWMILFPLTLLYALRKALSYWGGNETERRKGVLLCFLVFNILYISLIGNALEYGENNRFGFLVQPLVLILFGFLLSEWLARKDSQSKPITRDPE